jgi:6-phosphofructokinase 1
VDQIHHQGGTILASSRGGFDLEKILEFIKKHGINQMYIIGKIEAKMMANFE